jgi:hypothetical protein
VTITREQVADLREGDVVEYHRSDWPDGVVIRGPLHRSKSGGQWIGLATFAIRFDDGDVNGFAFDKDTTLTVVSRAPRPLYVNHDRTEPVPGDVVRDADSDDPATWHYLTWPGGPWYDLRGNGKPREALPARLRLLVDGETGQAVQ